jgi:hypothetical protein
MFLDHMHYLLVGSFRLSGFRLVHKLLINLQMRKINIRKIVCFIFVPFGKVHAMHLRLNLSLAKFGLIWCLFSRGPISKGGKLSPDKRLALSAWKLGTFRSRLSLEHQVRI